MIGNLIWSGGFIWCQFIDGSLYLCGSNVVVCEHGLWVSCLWDITEIRQWWGWEEDFLQCVQLLFIGGRFSFQCGDKGVDGDGVEVLVDFPNTVLVSFAYKFLPCFPFAFVHFPVEYSSLFFPYIFIFLSSILFQSSSGSLCFLS